MAKADAALFVNARVHSFGTGRSQMRSTSAFGPTAKVLGMAAAGRGQRFDRRDRRLRRQSSSATITHICEHANTAAAGSVHQQRFGLFDEANKFNDGTRDLLKNFVTTFAAWIETTRQG